VLSDKDGRRQRNLGGERLDLGLSSDFRPRLYERLLLYGGLRSGRRRCLGRRCRSSSGQEARREKGLGLGLGGGEKPSLCCWPRAMDGSGRSVVTGRVDDDRPLV
jgi:hypothetical protein